MSLAAFLPAPIALITVAAPVTTSPPAQMASREVLPVSSSATMFPFLPTSSPGVVNGISGFGLFPMLQTTASVFILNSDP